VEVHHVTVTIETVELASPVGPITVVAAGGAVFGLAWTDGLAPVRARLEAQHQDRNWRRAAHIDAAEPVKRYLEGDLDALDEVEVSVCGTPFQTAVWSELRRIPVGTTITYGELAARVDRPRAFRAVGAANGANPVSLVNPCHRVVAADGSLGGYGFGLERKQWLLHHEGAVV
jgi:methylated-DNA-[protein]-cysteine S-methyltransferase